MISLHGFQKEEIMFDPISKKYSLIWELTILKRFRTTALFSQILQFIYHATEYVDNLHSQNTKGTFK